MTAISSRELQAKQKTEASALSEPTTPGTVFVPAVDIFETEKEINLLADLPGVTTDDLQIDLRDNILTLSGNVAPFENSDENDIIIEYEVGKYYRQFTVSQEIDQEKIEAELKDGVLRLILPKADKTIPKKIPVKAA